MVESNPTRIVVAGAGPVGLAVAALLGVRDALDVQVFDGAAAPSFDPARVDLRVYALSRASQRLLEQLGIWTELCATRVCPYERMHVWEGEHVHGASALGFDCADIGEPDLGHIVEDTLLRCALLEALRAHPRVTVHHETAIRSVVRRTRAIDLTLASGERVSADLLVAADGAASCVRDALGLTVAVHDYRQHAIVTHVTTEHAHGYTAWQRFLPGGPLALLPLTDGRSSVVWTLPSATAQSLVRAADGAFLDALQAASGDVLGRLGPCTERVGLPLRLLHALRYTDDRVALVGDAAHSVHPLAGQGMNLGLLDAACLAEEVLRGVGLGLAPGDAAVLGRYERRRKGHNVEMMLAFDLIERVFRLPAWASPVRGLGLALLDRSGAAKRLLTSRALGLERLPRRAAPDRAARAGI